MTHQFYKTKPEIIKWLKSMKVENYKLIPDKDYGFVVDVNEAVELIAKGLTTIQIKFNIVKGGFYCQNNELTNLIGSPIKVGGIFYCHNNKLTSLTGCPSEVGGFFYCAKNKLTSLEGSPSKVGGDFYCENNKLTSLTGCPSEVGGDFYCAYNKLTNLMGISSQIKGRLAAGSNCITSLLYIPDNVGGIIHLENNPHASLKNLVEPISYQELYSLHIIDKIKHEKKLLSDSLKVSKNTQDKKSATAIHKV